MADQEIIKLYKKLGETPLECLISFKEANLAYRDQKLTYLGRLDPMAEGLILVAPGTVKRDTYLSLDKTYEFEVLWGISSDTYDVLGKVIQVSSKVFDPAKKMDMVLDKIINIKSQVYPPYSSRPVNGKPLFEWARENKIAEIEIPIRNIKIFNLEHIHTRVVDGQEVLGEATRKVSMVKGDFRQKEIINSWNDALKGNELEKFLVSKFVADVSSGTYIRSLANEMGKILQIPTLALSIKRTRIGEYRL